MTNPMPTDPAPTDSTATPPIASGQQHHETRILPPWLYPTFFWLALPVLALSLFFPGLSSVGLWYMMTVPALAALTVAVTQWGDDRRVSVAALVALLGLGLVVLVKGWIT